MHGTTGAQAPAQLALPGLSVYPPNMIRRDRAPQAPDARPEVDSSAVAVHRTPAQLRLQAAQADYDQLLIAIAKKKHALDLAEHQVREVLSAFEARAVPLRALLETTLQQIRRVMQVLLGPESPLKPRDRARVRRLYHEVMTAFDCSVAEACEDDGPGSYTQPVQDHQDGTGATGARARQAPPHPDGAEAGYSASKPVGERASLLRSLFRRLAMSMHPDKVQDEGEKATRTHVMKDITRAYEAGDLARLIELERGLLARVIPEIDERQLALRVEELVQANKALRRQLRELSDKLKQIKAALPSMPRGHRGSRAHGGGAQLEMMLEQAQEELDALQSFRDSARALAAGEISVRQFLSAPSQPEPEVDLIIEQVLSELLETQFAPRRSGPATASRTRSTARAQRTRARSRQG